MTGVVSPPVSLPCYAHDNGGCQHVQEQCLFSHRNTGLHHHHPLQICHPRLALRDVPIAEAAAKAGFDSGSWPKLRNLINAVRRAALPSHPDYWSDAGAQSSSIPPERYFAEQQRARKGVAQAYRDVDLAHQAATVPAFVVPAKQLIDNIRNGAPKTGSSLRCKRGHGEFVDLTQDTRKRLKTEGPSHSQGPNDARTSSYIDLTQDKPIGTLDRKGAINRRALGDISNNIPRAGTGKKFAKQQRRPEREQRYKHVPVFQEDRANGNPQQTAAIFAKIASRLHAIVAEIDADRDTLRERWEDDIELKQPAVTEDLAELNECFSHAQEALMDGIDTIKKKLLGSR